MKPKHQSCSNKVYKSNLGFFRLIQALGSISLFLFLIDQLGSESSAYNVTNSSEDYPNPKTPFNIIILCLFGMEAIFETILFTLLIRPLELPRISRTNQNHMIFLGLASSSCLFSYIATNISSYLQNKEPIENVFWFIAAATSLNKGRDMLAMSQVSGGIELGAEITERKNDCPPKFKHYMIAFHIMEAVVTFFTITAFNQLEAQNKFFGGFETALASSYTTLSGFYFLLSCYHFSRKRLNYDTRYPLAWTYLFHFTFGILGAGTLWSDLVKDAKHPGLGLFFLDCCVLSTKIRDAASGCKRPNPPLRSPPLLASDNPIKQTPTS